MYLWLLVVIFSCLLLFSFTVVVGLYYCFSNLSDARIFIIMYGVTSMYFSAVMVSNSLDLADRSTRHSEALFCPLRSRSQKALMMVQVLAPSS